MGGDLPKDWLMTKLEDCMDAIIDYRGKTPRKTAFGIPLITAKVVKGGRIETPNEFIDPGEYNEWMRRGLPKCGDVLVTTEAPLGEVAQITDSKVALAQRLIALRGKANLLDNTFLKFLMQTAYMQAQLSARASGTTVSGIKQSELRKIRLPLPPLHEQRAIAHILGTLDDKIELNRQMNRTLEEMARAIFKSWFVDFDPVRAKAAVRRKHPKWTEEQVSSSALPDLKPEIAALFPDSFEDSELGEIPKGWYVSRVCQHFRLTMGQSPPGITYNKNGEGVPFYQGRTDFGFRFPTRRVFCTAPTRFAETGDALVSVRAPVGDVNIANEQCAVGRGVAAIRHRSGSRSFTYYSMHHFRDHFGQFEAEGTVFGCINKADFERLPFIIPVPDIIDKFDRIVSPLDDRLEANELQSMNLSSIRDTLLPKLISGELRVKDAERIAGRYV